jgi:protein PhnA
VCQNGCSIEIGKRRTEEKKLSVRDSNGAELEDGDVVQVIKDLKVKGTSTTLKRGTTYKNIRLTRKDEEIECGKGKSTIVLKTCFLKKV